MSFSFPSKTPESSIQFATIISFLLVVIKGSIGILSWSLAILGSALDSFFDIFVSGINLFTLKLSRHKKTQDFSYGYWKAQGFGAVFEWIVIFATGVALVWWAVQSYRAHAVMTIELLELGIMLIAMCGSLLILWNFKQVKRNHTSLLLDSDILHYSSDLYMNGGVLLSLVGTRFLGWWWLDSLSGWIIGIFIVWNSLEILKKAGHMLLDHSLDPENLIEVDRILTSYQEIESYHNLRTRRSGDDIFLEVHLVFRDKKILLHDAHEIADMIEKDLIWFFPKIYATLHLEVNESEPYEHENENELNFLHKKE